MRTVGLKVLKNRLSEYVRAAAAGETVLVTHRDRVVAELVPPRTGGDGAEAAYAEAIRKGLITPARHPGSGAPASVPVASFEELMEELTRDREDR